MEEGVTFTGGGEKDVQDMNRHAPTHPNPPAVSKGPLEGPDMDGTPTDGGRGFEKTSPSWDATFPVPSSTGGDFESPVDDFKS